MFTTHPARVVLSSVVFVTAARTAYAGTEGCYVLLVFFFFFFI